MSITGPFDPSVLGSLSPEVAIARFRDLLQCEAQFARLRPDAITISANLHIPDGGIDAQVEAGDLPGDTILSVGRTGYQLKTGTTFKPWQSSSVKSELLSDAGSLASEVRRILESGGRYVLICFGLDLTPRQRNESHALIAGLFADFGFTDAGITVEIFGQSQISPYFERYPSLRLSLTGGSDEDFLTVSEWSRHAHMRNSLILSDDQTKVVELIRAKLRSESKHVRIHGEPGIGKTRLVLEAVLPDDISPRVLYVEHGDRFSQTGLFRRILREESKYPLVLVLDELSEREMTEIWGHLKHRAGTLKIVSIDHGLDRSADSEIEKIDAPRLPDQTIRAILAKQVGERAELDRWVSVCEGSPRVAQAVGENLLANPDDIFRPPATVQIWERFLFGYARHQSDEVRQITMTMRHIALFSRFGFEAPVGGEAQYISQLIERADPTVTWQRFQEIVQVLRERRVLQGSRTLFIVPWALHIHLWREYWRWYGRGFDFAAAFEAMPEALHGWFMEMFRYAHDSDAAQAVRDILHTEGIFSSREFLCSAKGASFLSTLAEADPEGSLTLLERTLGTWSKRELLDFDSNRQNIVWALEKIAVWRPTVVRAIRLLGRLSLAENSNYSNNASGTLMALFRIGPEWAATEASPAERQPALTEMLRSTDTEWRQLGLKVAVSALETSGHHTRMVGAEYQGVKEPAELWRPTLYDEWYEEYRRYWDCLVGETRGWVDEIRKDANSAILVAGIEQLRVPPHAEAVVSVIENVSSDLATDTQRLNHFFAQLHRRYGEKYDSAIRFRLRRLEGRVTRHSLNSRFERYVLSTTWDEWANHEIEDQFQEGARPRRLVRALAARIAASDDGFDQLLPRLVTSASETGALFAFGEALSAADKNCRRLGSLISAAGDQNQSQCLTGYFASLRVRDPDIWQEELLKLLANESTAVRGANVVWRSGFNDAILERWIDAFDRGWIKASAFQCLSFGMAWQTVPVEKMARLLTTLSNSTDRDSAHILVTLLDQVLKSDIWPIDSDLIFRIVTSTVHFEESMNTMHSHYWHGVCKKLVSRDRHKTMPMLDVLLDKMDINYSLSYDHYIRPFVQELCRNDPIQAWEIVASHLLSSAPKWRGGLLNWLKGESGGFSESTGSPPIAEFPLQTVIDWIAQDPQSRASMIAHCAPRSLDDQYGGAVTRALLSEYRNVLGVVSGISAIFHSGGWSGPQSQYLRGRRERFRMWLGKGFDHNVVSWIEKEITELDRRIEAAEISEEREPWNRPSRPQNV